MEGERIHFLCDVSFTHASISGAYDSAGHAVRKYGPVRFESDLIVYVFGIWRTVWRVHVPRFHQRRSL
ncbi:hypothetical protein D3C81_2263680 [compost metagenome]